MQFNILSFADNAQGQLDSGISASIKTIVLKSGEGAEFPQAYSDTATSAGDANTLNCTGIGAKVAVGDFLANLTDGSHCWCVTSSTNSVTTTDLIGGSANIWDNSDEWVVNPFVVTINSRDSEGQITASEKVLIKGRSTDTLTAETRGYDSSSAQTWDADDYVDLFVIEKGFSGLNDAISEISQLVQTLSDDKASNTDLTNLSNSFIALLNARNWKLSVRVATTANGTLSTAFANGQTVDGITLATDDRILLKDQTDATANGIYTVNASGAPTRATDFDLSAEITSAVVAVEEGTSTGDSVWLCTSEDVVIGTDDIDFVLLPGSPEIASQAEAEAGTDNTKVLTALRVKQATGGITIIAGTDYTSASAPTERSSTSASYVKLKEITINKTGTYTVSFDLRNINATTTAYGRIYKNGSPFGTERSTISSSDVNFSEDLAFESGDLLQLYVYTDGGGNQALVNDLLVKYSWKFSLAEGTVDTD